MTRRQWAGYFVLGVWVLMWVAAFFCAVYFTLAGNNRIGDLGMLFFMCGFIPGIAGGMMVTL